MNSKPFLFTIMAAMLFAAPLNAATVVRVADYGAIPDDGVCDAAAIRNVIAAAEGSAISVPRSFQIETATHQPNILKYPERLQIT